MGNWEGQKIPTSQPTTLHWWKLLLPIKPSHSSISFIVHKFAQYKCFSVILENRRLLLYLILNSEANNLANVRTHRQLLTLTMSSLSVRSSSLPFSSHIKKNVKGEIIHRKIGGTDKPFSRAWIFPTLKLAKKCKLLVEDNRRKEVHVWTSFYHNFKSIIWMVSYRVAMVHSIAQCWYILLL